MLADAETTEENLARLVTEALKVEPEPAEPSVTAAEPPTTPAWRAGNAEGLSIREAQQRTVEAREAVERRADTGKAE